MRAAFGVILWMGCWSAKPATTTKQPPAADAGVDAELVEISEPDAAVAATEPNWDRVGARDFDWDALRKQQDDARAARKADPNRCAQHDGSEICSPRAVRLAGKGKRVGSWSPEKPMATFLVDVGSEDGVQPYHWAAVLDDSGAPVTKYQRVQDIRGRQCVLHVEMPEHVTAAKIAIVDKPK